MLSCIDVKLLYGKAHYYFYFAGTAGVFPFLPLITEQLGASASVVGMLFSILPCIQLISKPLVSGIADKYHKKKCMVMGLLVLMTIGYMSVIFIRKSSDSTTKLPAEIICSDTGTYMTLCEDRSRYLPTADNDALSCDATCRVGPQFLCAWKNNANCTELLEQNYEVYEVKWQTIIYKTTLNFSDTPCPRYSLNPEEFDFSGKCSYNVSISNCHFQCNFTEKPDTKEQSIYVNYQFWWLCLIMVIGWIAHGVILSVTDGVIFDLLGKDRRSEFGLQRFWGTIGWGGMIILAGYLNDLSTKQNNTKDFTPGFYVFFGAMIIDFLMLSRLNMVSVEKPKLITKRITNLLRRPRVVLFIVSVYLGGVMTGVLETFLFLYLKELNASSLLLGFTRGMQCFGGEALSFLVSGKVIGYIGHVNAMTLVFAGFGVRFIAYYFIYDPWYILPVEMTHGITFGIYYATITSYASILAPSGMSTTLQGLVGGINEGAGMATGSLAGGFIFGAYGGRVTYCGFGLAALLFCILHFVVQCCISPGIKRKGTDLGPEEEALDGGQVTLGIIKMVPDSVNLVPGTDD